MTHRLLHVLASGALAASLLTVAQTVQCQESAVQAAHKSSRRIEWLDRPWELRYFFYVTHNWASKQQVAQRFDRRPKADPLDRRWETIATPTRFFSAQSSDAKAGEGLSVVIIEFEPDGTVKSEHTFGAPLRGRLDRLLYVTLSAGDFATQPRFDLGEWFMGLGDVSTHWAPGLCGTKNMPSPFSQTDTGYLYGPQFMMGPARPAFGCREWAYQLNEPRRPYIDITSYIPKKLDPDGPGTYIRDMIGWSDFTNHKPIIGKHENDWYCLHECPDGEAPGVIPDIKSWASKRGWSTPRPPTRVPTFPDPPAKSGTYRY